MGSREGTWITTVLCTLLLIAQIGVHYIVPIWMVGMLLFAGMVFATKADLYLMLLFFAGWAFFITYTGDRAGLFRLFNALSVFTASFSTVKY